MFVSQIKVVLKEWSGLDTSAARSTASVGWCQLPKKKNHFDHKLNSDYPTVKKKAKINK